MGSEMCIRDSSEQWVLGPTGQQGDEPGDLTEVMRTLMADARLNSDMGGRPRGGPGRPENEI